MTLNNMMNEMAPKKNKPVKNKNDMLKMGWSFTCTPIDDEWKETLKEKPWATNYEGDEVLDSKIIQLRDLLLSFGGEEACMPYIEEDIDNILIYGQLWQGGNKVKMMKGEPSQCHYNSCALYKANLLNTKFDGDLTIATGYALSKDGMWRQHSWLVLRKCRSYKIVETTEKREAYFGFAMNAEKCLEFMRDNL